MALRLLVSVLFVHTIHFQLQKTLPMRRRARILTDINVSFFHGAKVGLLGINGSGKSTLLRIIAGVDKEYEGRVVQGSAGLNIGFLQQEVWCAYIL